MEQITGRLVLYKNGLLHLHRVYKTARGRTIIIAHWQKIITENATWEYDIIPDEPNQTVTKQGNIKKPIVLA